MTSSYSCLLAKYFHCLKNKLFQSRSFFVFDLGNILEDDHQLIVIYVPDVNICGIWKFIELLMKLGAAFTFTDVNFCCVGMYWCRITAVHSLPALCSLPADGAASYGFDFL